MGCWHLTEVTIPDSVTNIGVGTFCSCSNLIKITIPNSVSNIGNDVFYNCTNLTTIFYQNKELKTKCVDGYFMVVKKVHEIEGVSILHCLYFGTNEKCFVAERNGISAHGETIKQAIDDLLFKQLQSEDYQLHIARIKEKGTMNSIDYRLLTGACQMGVDNFIREKNLKNDVTKEYPISEVLELTTGFWGNEKIIELLTGE